jgi:hypothetical protein
MGTLPLGVKQIQTTQSRNPVGLGKKNLQAYTQPYSVEH